MRIRTVLLVAAPAAAAGVVASGAFASAVPAPPGADYQWAQPGAAVPVSTCTQPSVPIAPVRVVTAVPGCSYDWAQPGAASRTTNGAQPPAWVPIAPVQDTA